MTVRFTRLHGRKIWKLKRIVLKPATVLRRVVLPSNIEGSLEQLKLQSFRNYEIQNLSLVLKPQIFLVA